MERILAIGDIHGGLRALIQAFERASVSQDDMLVFLGDYVDGWSESPQVLDFLIELQKTNRCVFLKGNHDDLLLDWLRGKENKMWHQHGGEATMLAYDGLPDNVRNRHISFLETLHNYYLDEQNRLFVHAGFTNLHGVAHEYFPRLLYWERTLWETALALDPTITPDEEHYPRRFKVYDEIYIGHTPVTRIGHTTPQNRANVWNLDTGAAFRGKLSVMDVDSKTYWQSDALPELYPDEKGRNQ